MRHSRLPALSELGIADIGAFFQNAISPDRLMSMGWSAAGGAAGTLVNLAVTPRLAGLLPESVKSVVPREALPAVVGFLAGSVAWEWNEGFARGFVGKVSGDLAEMLIDRFSLREMLAPAGSVEASPRFAGYGVAGYRGGFRGLNAAPPDQLAPLRTNVVTDPHQIAASMSEVIPRGGMGEVIPRGGFGANVIPIQREPTIQPTYRQTYSPGFAAVIA